MYFTYVIESLKNPRKRYTGHTSDLDSRLAYHNAGKVASTAKYAPWKLKLYIGFETLNLARSFGHYLKSGSSRLRK